MALPFVETPLAGWGRVAPATCAVYRPEKRRSIASLLEDAAGSTFIARGLGRSYGDAAVNAEGAVLDCTRLDRMLGFDEASGVLHAEAGVSLAAILEVFVPRGWFLPVTPGTKFVTLGGAIANDVHGKNHHRDGTFGQFVEKLELQTPAGERLLCSPTENEDVFWATVGGVGLTGVILTAWLRLQRIESAYVRVDYHKAADLDEVLAQMAENDARYKYSVAWVDCLAQGASLGRSVLMHGEHAPASGLPPRAAAAPLHLPPRGRKTVPADVPGFMLNRYSIGAFNEVFYRMHRTESGKLVDYERYFYPLDSILHWNRLYGRRGFVQYQATLPFSEQAGLVKLLERLAASGRASFLAVLKCFGEANPGFLSHPFRGYTLTLDVPYREGLVPFLHELDRILLDHGGRVYFAKDSAATADTIAKMYPRLDEFKALRARLDPEGVLCSSLARRTGLVA